MSREIQDAQASGRARWRGKGSIVRGGLAVLAGSLLLTACDLEVSGGAAEIVPRFSFTVNITNEGTGSGRVDVAFPGATVTVQNPCPEVLGPGETCSPRATAAGAIESVDITVVPAGGSSFTGWTEGPCPEMEEECTITDQSRDFDIEYDLTLRFDLPAG